MAIQAKEDKSTKAYARSRSFSEQSLWEVFLFAVFFVVIFSAIARAEAKTLKTTQPVNESSWKPSGSLMIETSGPAQEQESPAYGGWYLASLGIANKASGWSASTKIGFSREYTHEKDDGTDGAFDNPIAGISKKFGPAEDAVVTTGIWNYLDGISWGVSGSLPGNRESQRRTFLGSLGTSVKLTKSIRRFDVAQSFGYTRGFYEYDIRADGTVNSPDSFKSTTELSLNVTEKLALSVSIALSQAINYQGNAKASEASALSIDYTFAKNIATSFGVATERGTLQPDGETNRVKIFDPEVAQVFFDLILSL